MVQLGFALALLGIMGVVRTLPGDLAVFEPARLSLSYGFLLLEAYLLGGVFGRMRLPKISGYIAAGILCGPFVLSFIDAGMAQRMKLIDELALTFIALTAGAELQLGVLRQRFRTIGLIILSLSLVVGTGMAATTVALGGALPFAAGLGGLEVAAMGALIGVIAVARSPTSAIAIINECRAKGPFTDTVFGVTVAMDSLVILAFAVVVSVAEVLVEAGRALDVLFLGTVFLQLALSIAAGVAVGKGVAFYIRRVQKDLSVLLVVLAFLITEASASLAHLADARFGVGFHLEPLLIATAAGFTVQNFTGQGKRLVRGLHTISLPIFVVFFSMAGVGLNLGALALTWLPALLYALVRMGLIGAGAYLGCTVAGERPRFRRFCGLAFFTQAGVSLGLTQELIRRFPEWGAGLGTFLVACITINEIVGPVAFKFALDRMGESSRAPASR